MDKAIDQRHTPWRQGITLITEDTRKWTKAERERNDARERLSIFVNFFEQDQGRSRQLIATCREPEIAARICAAVNATANISTADLESGIVEEMREALNGTLADLRFAVGMIGDLAYEKRVEKISFRIRDIESILTKLTPSKT